MTKAEATKRLEYKPDLTERQCTVGPREERRRAAQERRTAGRVNASAETPEESMVRKRFKDW